MAVTVRIPTQLRPATGGESEAQVEGATVGEVLDALFERFDGLRERISDEGGALSAARSRGRCVARRMSFARQLPFVAARSRSITPSS